MARGEHSDRQVQEKQQQLIARRHLLGHVKDLGEDSTQIDKVRIYRTVRKSLNTIRRPNRGRKRVLRANAALLHAERPPVLPRR